MVEFDFEAAPAMGTVRSADDLGAAPRAPGRRDVTVAHPPAEGIDCTLFLQAQKLGLVVLTPNVDDYDILLQLISAGRVLFYRVEGQSGK